LPASFLFFREAQLVGHNAWPAIGPEVSGENLANCYPNVMDGTTNGSSGVLTFNPDNCYSGSGQALLVLGRSSRRRFRNAQINPVNSSWDSVHSSYGLESMSRCSQPSTEYLQRDQLLDWCRIQEVL